MQKGIGYRIIIFTLLLILMLILRKAGIPYAGTGITICGIILSIQVAINASFIPNNFLRIILIIFLLLSLSFLQNFQPAAIVSVVIFVCWLCFSFFVIRELKNYNGGLLLWSLITFVFLTALFFNPRKFYNFYRADYFEEFISNRYSATEGLVADVIIEKYKCADSEKSVEAYESALSADSSGEFDKALRLYNKAIDLNPDNPEYYHHRGFLKLTRLDINEDVAWSAIKDFSRSIRLKPDNPEYYFHRSLAYGYLGNQGKTLIDLKTVWQMDSTLTDSAFEKKYGKSKKSFFVPFHP